MPGLSARLLDPLSAGSTRAVKLFQLVIGVHDHRQLLLDSAQLRTRNGEVGLVIRGGGVDTVADTTEAGCGFVRVNGLGYHSACRPTHGGTSTTDTGCPRSFG